MKILKDNQGNVLVKNGSALSVPGTSPDLEFPTYTGTVDAEGLAELGWDAEDIAWLQAHVWWNAEENEYWKVTEANKAFGPNGATPLTWENRAEQKYNIDIRFYPKFILAPASNTSWLNLFNGYSYVCAVPTHGWDSTHVTSLSGLFIACPLLHSVGDLSDWNIGNATGISGMFSGCYNLVSVGDLSSWNTSKVTLMNGAFQNCYQLRHIGDLSNWNTENNTSFQSMFYSCSLIKSVGNLERWETGKVVSMMQMFYGCMYITSVGDLSNWDVSNVTTMQAMFQGCYRLCDIGDIAKWNVGNVRTMASMFYNCYSLHSIGDLSNWNTELVTNMSGMFTSCLLLPTIGDISNWNMTNVTNISSMFQNCHSLSLYSSFKNWDVRNVTTIANTFNNCLNMPSIDISGWNLMSCTTAGASWNTSIFSFSYSIQEIKLGPHFFDGTMTTIYLRGPQAWTRNSVYESLYTNQTLRDTSSRVVTVYLDPTTYDRLSQQDKDDIATKNITLMRG